MKIPRNPGISESDIVFGAFGLLKSDSIRRMREILRGFPHLYILHPFPAKEMPQKKYMGITCRKECAS